MAFTKILPAGISTTGTVTLERLETTNSIVSLGPTNQLYINTDTPTVRPTLDLNFERDQRLDSRITFSRDSTATYLGSDGLIKTAQPNIPRFEFDTDGNCLGFLIEESRTNLNTYSENLSSGYTLTRVIRQYSASEVAPDGTTGTVTIVSSDSEVGGARYIYPVTQNGAGTYTVSCFFKNQSTTTYFPQLRVFGIGSGQAYATFNLTGNGSITDSGGAVYENSTITPYSNNWYRCSMTFTTSGNSYLGGIVVSNSSTGELPLFDGSNSFDDGFLVWGFQNETGSFATSYIPTSGSTVTRSVDEATITGTNFTDWYNSSEGTIFAKYSAGTYASESPFGITKTGDEINQIIAIGSSSDGPISGVLPTIIVADSGVTQTGVTVPITPIDGDIIKTAIAYKQNDFAISSATDTESGFASDSSGTIPTVDFARIGKYPYYGIWQNRPIARIMYYPQRLSNTQLKNLTS
jgi:hypothetical protein